MESARGPYYYGRHFVSEDDIAAVSDVFSTGYLSQGPKLEELEKKVAAYCDASYCLAVNNGTAALHLACLALGLSSFHVGWTSPLSFVASANCIGYCGAEVGFVDIDGDTFNMSKANVAKQFERAADKKAVPRVIIPVHFAGQSCDMKEIRQIASHYGCFVIEDGCHALGGTYEGGPIGNCRYSDITVFSLHPVKSITSGEGGLILTNDKALYETMKGMRVHGIVRGEAVEDQNIGPWHVEMQTQGYNYKICELQCALGLNQLEKLDDFVATRRALAEHYQRRLAGLPIRLQKQVENRVSAWHLLLVLMDFKKIKKTKKDVYFALRDRGIHLSVHYYPIHLNPYYRRLGFRENMFPVVEAYYDTAFSLPLHPGLGHEDVDYICDAIVEVLN